MTMINLIIELKSMIHDMKDTNKSLLYIKYINKIQEANINRETYLMLKSLIDYNDYDMLLLILNRVIRVLNV